MIHAASRQGRIRDTLRDMTQNDRTIIDAAYGLRNLTNEPGGQALLSEFGQAATLAYKVLRGDGTRKQAEQAAKLLRGAQTRYLRLRRRDHGKLHDKLSDDMDVAEKRRHKVAAWKERIGL